MALGGGVFTSQNKILPGSYINVISKAQNAALLGERGVVALPIALKWGKPGSVITVTAEDFQRDSLKIFGYAYDAPEMETLREVFKHAQKVHVYNLSNSTKACCPLMQISDDDEMLYAKYEGSRGADMRLVIQTNIDDATKFDVSVYMGSSVVFSQTVSTASELNENDYVTWKEFTLSPTAGLPFHMQNGVEETIDSTAYQNALDTFESYNFNVLVCPDASAADLYVAYTKRMRDNVGVKFQTVVVNKAADYEGVVNIPEAQANALYWTAGALAGCAVNKSCTNMLYDGELTITCTETQRELEDAILAGVFMFHKVESDTRVLMDINSLVTYTEDKGEVFSSNQVVRVADQCANDTAKIFNTKFLGKVQNDNAGRISFWNQVLTHRRELETMRAIEAYDSSLLTVERGEKRNSVVVNEVITPISAMEKLYMTIVIN